MRFLLMTDHSQRAQGIAEGLRYENLDTEVLDISFIRQGVPSLFHRYDGYFLFFNNLLLLKSSLEILALHCSGIFIGILSTSLHSFFFDLYDRKKISKFYIRPFPFRIIASETRSLIFQYRERMKEKTIIIRDLVLDRDAHEMRLSGQTIYLRHKEFALLEYLMVNAGKVLTRGNILEHVWDRNAEIFTNTVDVHINQLRRKIKPYSDSNFIKTIPCQGYMFS